MATTNTPDFVKETPTPSAEHRDVVDGNPLEKEHAASGLGLSGYETLSLWETVKAFKMTTFVCFMMCFSAATDGYQIGCVSYRSDISLKITTSPKTQDFWAS
jgi:hypothetical protein